MKLLTLILAILLLTGCVTYPPQRTPYYGPDYSQAAPLPQYRDPDPQPRPRSFGVGVNTDGEVGGWFNTLLNIGGCLVMPTVHGGTSRTPTGNVQVNCN